MSRIQTIIFSIILLFSGLALEAGKKGFFIKISIQGVSDSLCYLAYYYTDKTYLEDTAWRNNKGEYIFEGDKPLEQGVYIVAGQSNNKIFELLITEDQHIGFTSDTSDIIGNMNTSGSDENRLFYKYINFLAEKRREVNTLHNIYKNLKGNEDSLNIVLDKINEIDKEVKQYRGKMIEEHTGTFVSKFILSTVDPIIPDPPDNNGVIDSSFAYKYYKVHYWDNIDLQDGRLLKTPFFYSTFDKYFSQLLQPNPDSIIKEIDIVLEKVKMNKDVFNYFLWNLTIKYERSEYMGFDAIFVHIVNKYYKTGQADWLNETVKNNIIDRANILAPLLIGEPAPLMILQDTNQIPTSLYGVNAKYTLIYFWDTDCSHCKKETPKLKELLKEDGDSLDLKIYAVCIDTSQVAWKNYIRKNQLNWINVNGYRSYTPDFHNLYDVHSSPVFYLLDENKIIIAKRILTDQIKGIIQREENSLINN